MNEWEKRKKKRKKVRCVESWPDGWREQEEEMEK